MSSMLYLRSICSTIKGPYNETMQTILRAPNKRAAWMFADNILDLCLQTAWQESQLQICIRCIPIPYANVGRIDDGPTRSKNLLLAFA